MPVPITTDERKAAIKQAYNESVQLLEVLNILISKIDTYNPKLTEELIRDVADKSIELGGSLYVNMKELMKEDEEDEECFHQYPYGF